MANNKYKYYEQKEPKKANWSRYFNKKNVAIGILMLISIYYIANFIYSNINPYSIDYAYTHYNIIPSYWLEAMQFLNQSKYQYNVSIFLPNSTQLNKNGKYVLSWWDYGDWINWFGNSRTVLRGDNQVPELDYATAYQFINGNATTLKQFMKQENADLVIFSSDDFSKYQALNYLSCIYQNKTNLSILIGTSSCELNNLPTYLFFPQNLTSVNDYCANISNSTTLYIKAVSNRGGQYCLQEINTNNGYQIDGKIYYTNGTTAQDTNLIPISVEPINGRLFDIYLLEYFPLNYTTCQMPSGLPNFYYSNLYMGEFMGCLKGFKQVYPQNGAFGNVRIYTFGD